MPSRTTAPERSGWRALIGLRLPEPFEQAVDHAQHLAMTGVDARKPLRDDPIVEGHDKGDDGFCRVSPAVHTELGEPDVERVSDDLNPLQVDLLHPMPDGLVVPA